LAQMLWLVPWFTADSKMRRRAEAYAAWWKAHRDALRQNGTVLPDELLPISERLFSRLEHVEVELGRPPATVAHLDYTTDNLFFAGANNDRLVGVADWGCVGQARGVYDVAYFTGTSLETERRRAWEMRLLHGYHAASACMACVTTRSMT
jgi:Ser/Thr protein kinase RdoA (MazF antagonist)